ncbi:MAG: hypothetical protein J0L93_06500 [Deltaproteobacteria bacterium]|nr:hypothetical protein [Deltaproteobacteria bacterium]
MANQTSFYTKSISSLIIVGMLASGCSGGGSAQSAADDAYKNSAITDYQPITLPTTTATTATSSAATETPAAAPAPASSDDDSGGIGKSATWFLATVGIMAAVILGAYLLGAFDSKEDKEKKEKDSKKDVEPAQLAPKKVDPQTSRANLKDGEEYGTSEEIQQAPQVAPAPQIQESYTTDPLSINVHAEDASTVVEVPAAAAPAVEKKSGGIIFQGIDTGIQPQKPGEPIRNILSGNEISGPTYCNAVTEQGHGDVAGAEAAQAAASAAARQLPPIVAP